jgi:hypothetical protein
MMAFRTETFDALPIFYEGVLQILNPMPILSLLENSIGPAKDFGDGMMLLHRI